MPNQRYPLASTDLCGSHLEPPVAIFLAFLGKIGSSTSCIAVLASNWKDHLPPDLRKRAGGHPKVRQLSYAFSIVLSADPESPRRRGPQNTFTKRRPSPCGLPPSSRSRHHSSQSSLGGGGVDVIMMYWNRGGAPQAISSERANQNNLL